MTTKHTVRVVDTSCMPPYDVEHVAETPDEALAATLRMVDWFGHELEAFDDAPIC